MNQSLKMIKLSFQLSVIAITAFAIGCSVGDKKLQNNEPITEQLGKAAAKTNEGILTDRQALADMANMAGISRGDIDNDWLALRTSLPVDGYILRYGAVNSAAYAKLGAAACGEALINNRQNARQKLAPTINFGQNAATNLPDDTTKASVAQTMATAMQGGRQLDQFALSKVVEAFNLAMAESTDIRRVLSVGCLVIISRGQNTIR